ncbi:MAG TPA: alanine racemase [Xanthobacteraceae bacterium]|nr:alanine racemase [Xanthobacteraceae bacterium]
MAPRSPKPLPIPPAEQPGTPDESGGLLTIDLAAITANWNTLRHRAAPAECAAVVKADAYGCGLVQVGTALANAGATTFFVANLGEGRQLRAFLPRATIYVLNGVYPGTAPAFAAANLRPVINTLTELAEWDAHVAATDWRGGAALHVDTGMNRLGLSPDEAAAIASRIRSEDHGISLLMSHLACAEMPDHPLTRRQVKLFRDLRLLYRGIPASLANSSGIFLPDTSPLDIVRPGAALYGSNPTPGQPNPMQPVVTLQGRILQIRQLTRGDSVGYGATFTARGPVRIAVVAVGYGDGYARSACGEAGRPAEVIVEGHRCPLLGRISMDMLTVDISALPEGVARRGGMATLIGDGIDVDELAARTGTIGYEILTRLGRRHHRIWRETAPETETRTAAATTAA